MSEVNQKFNKPPLVEAVFDINCRYSKEVDLASITDSAAEILHISYPKIVRKFRNSKKVPLSQTSGNDASRTIEALLFRNQDENQIFQIRLGGFSFNRLAPYTNMNDYMPVIKQDFSTYNQIMDVAIINSLRISYLNKIDLQLENGQIDLTRYFNSSFSVPDGINGQIYSFDNKYEIEIEEGLRIGSHISVVGNEDKEVLTIGFTIFVILENEFDKNDWMAIEAGFKRMREYRNMVFYKTLTEECLELFKV